MKDLDYLANYRLPDVELKLFGIDGDSFNGCFKVYVDGRSFFAVVSNGGGWYHVSVSPCNRKRTLCPTWEEMCEIKRIFFEPDECVVEYHPPESEYVDMHPYCLHLWRPNDGRTIPMPPSIFVGVKGERK